MQRRKKPKGTCTEIGLGWVGLGWVWLGLASQIYCAFSLNALESGIIFELGKSDINRLRLMISVSLSTMHENRKRNMSLLHIKLKLVDSDQ